jgi:hypothetical protein
MELALSIANPSPPGLKPVKVGDNPLQLPQTVDKEVAVLVGVAVGVFVVVTVGVSVGVLVAVLVGVMVAVEVAVFVGVGRRKLPKGFS